VFLAIGLLVVVGSILPGYTMHGGAVAVLIQVSEFIIICGCAAGAVFTANKPSVVLAMFKCVLGLLKPSAYSRQACAELLQVLYELFYAARRDAWSALKATSRNPRRVNCSGSTRNSKAIIMP